MACFRFCVWLALVTLKWTLVSVEGMDPIIVHLQSSSIVANISSQVPLTVDVKLFGTSEAHINLTHNRKVLSTQRVLDNGTHTFQISINTIEDAGAYKLISYNNGSTLSTSHTFTVYVPANVSVSLEFAEVDEGNSVSVSCVSTGFTLPTVQWLSGMQTHQSTSPYTAKATLQIANVRHNDSGVYQCQASHVLNGVEWKVTANFVLLVNHIPYLESTSPATRTEVKFNKRLTLSCQFRGRPCPVAQWKINNRKVTSNNTFEAIYTQTSNNGDSSSNSTLTVYNGLILGPKARISCQAANRLGHSEVVTFALEYDYFGGKYYLFSNTTKLRRGDSKKYCQEYGGHPADILNKDVDLFLKDKCKFYNNEKQLGDVFISGRLDDADSLYKWSVTGTPFYNYSERQPWFGPGSGTFNGTYFNWEYGRPIGQRCMMLALNTTFDEYTWRDADCQLQKNFICHFQAEPIQYMAPSFLTTCEEASVEIKWKDMTCFNGTLTYSIVINDSSSKTESVHNFTVESSNDHQYSNTIEKLKPNTDYVYQIKLFPEYWNFPTINTTFNTRITAVVQHFQMFSLAQTCSLNWSWLSINARNFTEIKISVDSYPHKVRTGAAVVKSMFEVNVPIDSRWYNFSTSPNTQYVARLHISVCNKTLEPIQAVGKCITPVAAPFSIEQPTVKESSITVLAVNETNGPISCYFVIGSNSNKTENTTFSWQGLQSILSGNDSDWYCAVAVPRFSEAQTLVVLGSEDFSACDVFDGGDNKTGSFDCYNIQFEDERRFSVVTTTPNGGQVLLQQSAFVYAIGLGTVTTTDFTEQKTTNYVVTAKTSQPAAGVSTVVIATAVSGSLFVVIAVALIIVFDRKRRSKEEFGAPVSDTGFALSDHTTENKVYAIPVSQLTTVYRNYMGDIDNTFGSQFMDLKKISERLLLKTEVGSRADSRKRNRYKDIVAYDFNRVKLQTSSGEAASDYINASYINGYQHPKKFIAAQGPTEHTLEHFWRMIWQQNCGVVVMLTNLTENHKLKCAQYWPSSGESATFGDVTVELRNESNYGSYVVRDMVAWCGVYSLAVTQYHFTAWPDHGVPSTTTGLVRFCAAIEAAKQEVEGAPILVHCSAGVGRTGTYIGLDIVKRQMENENKVDVFNTVFAMRKQRVDMVQKLDQYILMHTILYETCLFGYTEFSSEEAKIRASDIQRITREFEMLVYTEPIDTAQDSAFVEQNVHLNRDSKVLPYDRSRVLLLSDGDASNDYVNFSGYINASLIQGYFEETSTIVTQGPMESTCSAFWRLILDRSVTAIFMLTDIGQDSCEEYWIDELNAPLQVGNVTVTMTTKDESMRDMTMREFLVEIQGVHKISVQHIHCNPRRSGETGEREAANLYMELVSLSRRLRRDSLPIVVHCRDGAGRSGVFCALSNILERCSVENKIDVFRTVKDLRDTRPLMVRTLDEYKVLYAAIDLAFSDDNPYANI